MKNCDSHFHTELAKLYQPISRITKINNELKLFVENYIYEMGINTIERVSGIAINVSFILLRFNLSFVGFRIQKFILKQ